MVSYFVEVVYHLDNTENLVTIAVLLGHRSAGNVPQRVRTERREPSGAVDGRGGRLGHHSVEMPSVQTHSHQVRSLVFAK